MANAVLRAKCRINQVSKNIGTDGSVESETIKLTAVYENSPENKDWSKWTPLLNCKMQINNPNAFDKLSKGHQFYVDFIPVEKE